MVTLDKGIKELQIGQNIIATEARRQDILKWIAPPDPFSNHTVTCKKTATSNKHVAPQEQSIQAVEKDHEFFLVASWNR